MVLNIGQYMLVFEKTLKTLDNHKPHKLING